MALRLRLPAMGSRTIGIVYELFELTSDEVALLEASV